MEIKSSKHGGNLRNRRAKGHLERGRNQERRDEAKVRQEAYSKLTLDQKLAQQEPFKGKQYAKLLAIKEKQNAVAGA